ncbi:MAG: ATP-binding cassette domain-containing protein [Nitrospira sp.]|nr:ATP-binding cassette domain-containing protein [Nitrospira sp.]
MILLNDVSKSYDKKVVFKHLSLTIKKGELVYVTGPSGAGKTTLLKLIYCSEYPDSGKINVDKWEVSNLKHSAIPKLRRNIGIVFQDFKLFSTKTVFENIALPLRFSGMHPQKIRGSVVEMLKKVKLLHTADNFPPYLSGGEQQRIVIARAMVTNPLVLLADEPTGNLDAKNAKSIMNLFNEINTKGTTVVIATHNTEIYRGTGRRGLYIDNKYIEKEFIG